MKLILVVVACIVACQGNGIWVPVPFVPAVPSYYTNYTNFSNPVIGNNLAWGGCRPNYYNTTGTHSVFVGCVGYNDKLLYNEAHVKSGKWFGAQEVIIRYPSQGYIRYETITGIWIFDRYRNGQGGYARIISGGPGSKNATIQLYSTAWLRGFNFFVEIYGN